LTPSNEVNPKSLRREQLIIEELGTELMIYDQKRNQAFCLNQKAAFVWRHCDGKTTLAEIAAKLAQALDEPTDEEIVQFALQNLSHDGLLEPSTVVPFVPAGLTRRDVMQRIGAHAAVTLPLVTALLVATPKAHASSKGPSTPKPPHGKP
jgi:hypothetical protein